MSIDLSRNDSLEHDKLTAQNISWVNKDALRLQRAPEHRPTLIQRGQPTA